MRDGNLGLLKMLIGLEEGQQAEVCMSTNYDEILKYTRSRSALDYVLHSTHFFSRFGNGPLFSAISGEIG